MAFSAGDDETIGPDDGFAFFVHKLRTTRSRCTCCTRMPSPAQLTENLEPAADADVLHTFTKAIPAAVSVLIGEGRLAAPQGAVGPRPP